MNLQDRSKYSHDKWVRLWLWVGVCMVIIQVMIGGITRLTGSGLSITKWEIALGTIPPLNAQAWQDAFDLYKETPQYLKINQGMSLPDFKFIYFWEYFHRLWARSLGFVFIIPLIYFLIKKRIKKALLKDLMIIVLLGATVGVFGWIMVASGLVDRPWVNAYKLTLHLNLAFVVFGYLLWTVYKVSFPDRMVLSDTGNRKLIKWSFAVMCIQLILGGIVSGMKASLFFPTWPLMHGVYVPETLSDPAHWNFENFKKYDNHGFAPAFFQFFHRNVGYILYALLLILSVKLIRSAHNQVRLLSILMLIIIHFQVIAGILVLLNSKGSIPVTLGVLHQVGALGVIGAVLGMLFFVVKRQNTQEAKS